MSDFARNERGSALVTALFFITGLTVAAAVIAMVATSEKRTAQNEYTHTRSFYSSDAGTEAAINWVRERDINDPPIRPDNGDPVQELNSYVDLQGGSYNQDNRYKYGVDLDSKRTRPGWDVKYKDYNFTIDADGASAGTSSSQVEAQVTRLFHEGY